EEDPVQQKLAKQAEKAAERQEKAAVKLAEHGSLIANGDFETDSKGNGTPDHWGGAKQSIFYVTEGENTFMRFQSNKPGDMVVNYSKIDIPAGTKAMELTWDWRIQNLKPGKEKWFDARFMLKQLDAAGNKI